jgi:hypothetical protein
MIKRLKRVPRACPAAKEDVDMLPPCRVALVLIALSLAACSEEPDPVFRSGPRPFIASAPPPYGYGYYRPRGENDWDEENGRYPDRPPAEEPEPTPPPGDSSSQNIPEETQPQPDNNAPAPTPSSLPTAKSVGNGRVESPYAPGKQVDVQGYPPGSTVRDPYTGQLFIVPVPQSGGQ